MTMKLTNDQVSSHLHTIPLWTFDPKAESLNRTFKFADFADALGFMMTVGVHAQVRDHHPEWRNVYSKVEVTWRTHDCGGVSMLDVEMAQKCDQVYIKYDKAK